MSGRHGEITPFNHGPYVVVTAYIIMVTMLIFVLTRLITKALATGALHMDDYFIITSAVSCLPGTVAHGQYLADDINQGIGYRSDHTGPRCGEERPW